MINNEYETKENENQTTLINFSPISSPESPLPLSSGTGNEGLLNKAISNHDSCSSGVTAQA